MVFGILALMSLALGLGCYLLAERLDLEDTTARLIVTAFLVAAILDAVVVICWGGIGRRKS